MKQDLPNILFKSGIPESNGLEVLTIENLRNRRGKINHDIGEAHQVSFNMLVLYTAGNTSHFVDFVWHPVSENTLIHVQKGQVNAFRLTEYSKGFIVLFTEKYLEANLLSLSDVSIIYPFNTELYSPRIQVPEESNLHQYTRLLFQEFYGKHGILNRKEVCAALYTIILTKLGALKKEQHQHLMDNIHLETFLSFKKYLQRDFAKNRNAVYYAELLHITYKHLNTVCKEVTGITVKECIDRWIILEAKRKLVNSGTPTKQLAFEMGFEESTNFVKYFKKRTGFTPNSFRKSFKQA